jgi:hypothetical protein
VSIDYVIELVAVSTQASITVQLSSRGLNHFDHWAHRAQINQDKSREL